MLLALLGWALAAEVPCAPDIAEFRTSVDLTSAAAGTIDESYRFALPEGCTVVKLPRALDGMAVAGVPGGGQVADGVLTRTDAWGTRRVLSVTRRQVLKGGPFAQALQAPDFPVATMLVEISTPLQARLAVWTEPTASVEVRRDKVRRYRATFAGGGQLTWSTEKDWWAVGDHLNAIVDKKIAPARALGPLADGLMGVSPVEALRRAHAAVALVPGSGGFAEAADAAEVIRRGKGNAAERALVMLSMLRAAGHAAEPALLRLAGSPEISMSVPGMDLLREPVLVIERPDGVRTWVDPRSQHPGTEDLPTRLRGSIALIPGDYPFRLHDHVMPDGRIVIEATAVLKDNGALELTATVQAEGAATQAVRDVLTPLNKDFRKQWLEDLLLLARPDAGKLKFQLYGVDDPALPFGMTIDFKEPKAASALGDGLRARVPAVLAPQLARVLPPNIEVVERVVLEGTGEQSPYGVLPTEDPLDPHTIVSRRADVAKGQAILTTNVLRPWRTSASADASVAALYAATERAPEVVLFGAIDKVTARKLRADANNTETRVLEALLWYEAGVPEEAEKALRRAVRSARVRTLVDVLRRFTPEGELRPWNVVWDAVTDDHDRLAIVAALEKKHERREAWRRASLLVESADDAVRVEALVTVARVQADRPPANIDPEAHKAWREPSLLLARAEKVAREVWGEKGHPAIDIPAAQQLVERGKCAEAGPIIERLLANATTPAVRAVDAERRACLGDRAVLAELEGIVREASFDPTVIATIVRAYQRLARTEEARRWSMLAAHIAGSDVELWMDAATAALAMGDLPSAVYATRRASDLSPSSMNAAVPLQILATLAGDAEQAALATRRSEGYAASVDEIPISMASALTFVTEDQRLGFLRVRDADVLRDPELLEERARRHLALGDELGAVRDAAWLSTVHRSRSADAYAYVASAEEVWSTAAGEELSRSVKEDEVRRLRMEHALLTGALDPLVDARALPSLGPAQALIAAADRAEEYGLERSWPSTLWEPTIQVPEGFRESPLLGAMLGVRGFTNRDAGAVLLVSAEPERLPPPVDGVFALGERLEDVGKVALYRLDGGGAPAFVATRRVGEHTWWGLARSRQLARFAVDAGIAAQSAQ